MRIHDSATMKHEQHEPEPEDSAEASETNRSSSQIWIISSLMI